MSDPNPVPCLLVTPNSETRFPGLIWMHSNGHVLMYVYRNWEWSQVSSDDKYWVQWLGESR